VEVAVRWASVKLRQLLPRLCFFAGRQECRRRVILRGAEWGRGRAREADEGVEDFWGLWYPGAFGGGSVHVEEHPVIVR